MIARAGYDVTIKWRLQYDLVEDSEGNNKSIDTLKEEIRTMSTNDILDVLDNMYSSVVDLIEVSEVTTEYYEEDE